MSPAADNTPRPKPPLSFAMLALCVVGAAVVVMVLTVAAVYVVPDSYKLAVAIVGLIATIAAMAVVSNLMTNRAIRQSFPESDND